MIQPDSESQGSGSGGAQALAHRDASLRKGTGLLQAGHRQGTGRVQAG